jgi:predicted ferric reductase
MLKFTLILILIWSPSLLMEMGHLDDFFVWRHALTILTGFISLSYMCLATLLSARFKWVEQITKGLDKGYALHKKLGIGATIALLLHWATVKSAHWLLALDLIVPPEKHKPLIDGINWHGLGEQVGEISFKIFIVFSFISLVQAISYNKFKFTHKIAGLLIFAGVFHSALLLDWNIQSIAINIAIVPLAIAGVYASWISLSGRIGKINKSKGLITFVNPLVGSNDKRLAVHFAVKLDEVISYKEAQFAYLDFHDNEYAHPFSILNYDQQSNVIEFAVKDLGDYTNKLVNNLNNGQKVTIEGGYGRFQISDFAHQVWVGAGIGIVPFISRLYWLQRKENRNALEIQKIHFFYCINSQKDAFFQDEIITILNGFSFIELHIFDAQKEELLDGEKIKQLVDDKPFEVSFCGPSAFAKQLQTDLALSDNLFHREIFKMR